MAVLSFDAEQSPGRIGSPLAVKHTGIIVTHYGGPDELRVVEEECPEPKEGEVRVRVLAAGVSLPDLLIREGIHPDSAPQL
jgi:NADPH:quinone reductase-like Zn-dependent oxidoreductase